MRLISLRQVVVETNCNIHIDFFDVKIFSFIVLNALFFIQFASSQVILNFQGNEIGDTWNFTTTGASSSALVQANAIANKVTGTKSIVVGGNTGGGSCYDGGSGNGTVVENKITFQPVNIASSNEYIRTLTFHWGSRFPQCAGTGWDAGEDLSFVPILDGIPQVPIIIAVGNVNANFNIRTAAQQYTYTISTCVNSFSFELKIPTNRSDELLFVDDVSISTPSLNTVFNPVLNITGDSQICAGSTSNLSTDIISGISYDWSGLPTGASFTTPNNTSNSNAMTIDWGTAAAGTYQIKVKPRKTQCGIDVFGTEVTYQIEVNSNPDLTVSPAISMCIGDTVTLNANGANTYLWSNGLGTNSSAIVSPSVTTSYQVTGYNGNCSSTESVLVSVNPSSISAGNDLVVCAGSSVTLSATGATNFSWDQNVVNGIPFIPTETNTYTVTSTGSCAGTDQITVTVEELPKVDFSADLTTGCSPVMVQFENFTSGNNGYQWSFSDGASSNLSAPNHTFITAGCNDITLTATSPNGCITSVTFNDFICVSSLPDVQFTSNIDQIDSEKSTVEFTNQSIGASIFEWNFGDGTYSTEFSTTHSFDPFSLANQIVTLVATNNEGCSDTASMIIYFKAIPSIYVPNAFTPNGDEMNQVFIPKFGDAIDPTKYSLTIFNRWGEIVFETVDIQIGWNGTFKGQDAQEGEYIWKMRYGIVEGVDQIEKLGHVALIR
ncbi:MAG: gliding motility-associated C-terminal domain-containing protein [Crocinitomicaceae bacterium]|nr:gliding motility-associated C-terminal domain-containing protein [Crocinitomicaceae bacterium]